MNGAVIKLVSRLVRPYSFSRNFLCTSVGPDVSPLVSAVASPPIVVDHKYKDFRVTSESPREAWVEGLSTTNEEKVGIVSLHPDIFAALPRLDIIHENVVWQLKYKKVNYRHAKIPVEMRGPGKGFGRKPWPQKGTGRARQGSTRAPQWVKGGTVHGPRRFTTNFYMLPLHKRVLGLISTLSGKFAQNDLKIVDSLEMPSDEAAFLEDVVRERSWGNSVLFVDANDEMPRNITLSTDQIPHFNLLPVYGLNVHSMLKHDTLVLTLSALDKIQERLLNQLNRPDYMQKNLQKYVH